MGRLILVLCSLSWLAVGCGDDSGGSAGTGGSARDSGACDDASDLEALEDAHEELAEITLLCTESCAEPDDAEQAGDELVSCVSDCVEEAVPGLSAECRDCFSGLSLCGVLADCMTRGEDPSDQECIECLSEAGCLNTLRICTEGACPHF